MRFVEVAISGANFGRSGLQGCIFIASEIVQG
jgi:hypothetical protein